MIPKFRAWSKNSGILEVIGIIFEDSIYGKKGVYTKVHVWDLNKLILMQSIGLKDKNGKEIFEGDILKKREKFGEVSWNNIAQMRYIKTKYGTLRIDEMCEVIGNIHENPELIKEK